MLKNKFYVEKFENRPGIYVIYSEKTKKIYIGQSKRLKERVYQHIKNLFSDSDNNRILQEDFRNSNSVYSIGCLCQLTSEEDLNYWEGIYYKAAKNLFGSDVYNELTPPDSSKSDSLDEEKNVDDAKTIIKNVLNKMEEHKGECITLNKLKKMKDWIPSELLTKLNIKTVSFKQMLENNEADFLLFAKAGDYIGTDRPDTICETLEKKVKEMDSKKSGRCLWTTSGPGLHVFNKWLSLYHNKYGTDKKVYALFKFTLNPFSQEGKKEKTFFADYKGERYTDTVPAQEGRENATKKALVIKKFYAIKEELDFEKLQDRYYRFGGPVLRASTGKLELNSLNVSHITLYAAILNAVVVDKDNDDVRESLGISDKNNLLDVFKKTRNTSREDLDFLPCEENSHRIYYLLAEVEDYIQIRPLEKT